MSERKAFLGRTEELQAAVGEFTGTSTGRVLVNGVAGVGKTAFLRALVDEPAIVARFGPRRFYATVAGAATVDALVLRVSTAIGEAPPSSNQGLLLEKLAAARALLAIDDADIRSNPDALGFDELATRLTKVPGLSLIAAARHRFGSFSVRWSRVIELTALDREHARELLIHSSGGAAAKEEYVEQLLDHAGKIPLAVELVGKAIGTGVDAAAILQKVQTAEAGLAQSQSPATRLMACFLDTPSASAATRAIALLSRLPDGVPDDLLTALGREIQEQLRELTKFGLVTVGDGRMTLLVSTPEAANVAADVEPADGQVVESFYLGLVERVAERIGKRGGAEASRMLAEDARNIEWAIGRALSRPDPVPAIDAALSFGNFMRYSGQGSLALLEKARDVAHAAGHQRSEADIRRRIGDVARTRFDINTAMASYEAARVLYQRIGYFEGVAACISNRAGIVQARQQLDEAAALFRDAASIYRRVNDEQGEALCTERLGDIAFSRSRYDAAVPLLNEALAVYKRLGDLRGQGNCLQTLGDIACERQQWDEADETLSTARDLHKDICNVLGVGNATFSRGTLKLGRGDPAAAKLLFDEAYALYRSLGNLRGEANCLTGSADCLEAAGDDAGARRGYEEAVALYRRVGDVLGEANCIKSLGALAQKAGHSADARRLYLESLPLYLQVDDPWSTGEIYRSLSEVEPSPSERRAHLNAAIAAYRQTGRSDAADIVNALLARLDGLAADRSA